MSSVNFISRIEFLSWLMIAWLLNMYNTLFLSSIIDRIVLCLQGFDQRWFFLMCPQMRRSLTSRNLESDHRQLKSHGKIVMKYMNIVTPKLLFFNCLLSLMSWLGMEITWLTNFLMLTLTLVTTWAKIFLITIKMSQRKSLNAFQTLT